MTEPKRRVEIRPGFVHKYICSIDIWNTLKLNYLMFRLIMVPSFSPLSDGWPVKYHNGEIRIQKKDPISSNGSHIKESWFWSRMKRVRDQRGLNHNYWISHIFPVQYHPKVSRLIWAVVEDLQTKEQENTITEPRCLWNSKD